MWDLIVSVPDHCLSFLLFTVPACLVCHWNGGPEIRTTSMCIYEPLWNLGRGCCSVKPI